MKCLKDPFCPDKVLQKWENFSQNESGFIQDLFNSYQRYNVIVTTQTFRNFLDDLRKLFQIPSIEAKTFFYPATSTEVQIVLSFTLSFNPFLIKPLTKDLDKETNFKIFKKFLQQKSKEGITIEGKKKVQLSFAVRSRSPSFLSFSYDLEYELSPKTPNKYGEKICRHASEISRIFLMEVLPGDSADFYYSLLPRRHEVFESVEIASKFLFLLTKNKLFSLWSSFDDGNFLACLIENYKKIQDFVSSCTLFSDISRYILQAYTSKKKKRLHANEDWILVQK